MNAFVHYGNEYIWWNWEKLKRIGMTFDSKIVPFFLLSDGIYCVVVYFRNNI